MTRRRIFLRDSAIVLAGMGMVPSWLARAAALPDRGNYGKKKVLVVIFMRGAADGLNIVVPFSESRYRELRPTLALSAPVKQSSPDGPFGNTIDLDGKFAFNGALKPLMPFWANGQLAIIEATGSPDSSRSHFDAQDFMESGTTSRTLSDGWLNRAMAPSDDETSPLRAVALGSQIPHTLRGDHDTIAIGDAQQFNVGNHDAASALESMYAGSHDQQWGRTGKAAFDGMKLIQSINKAPYAPQNGAKYDQAGDLGRNLQELARLIKANAGVEAAFAEIGGWDHHGNENSQLPNVLNQFSNALAAFSRDMGDRMEDVVTGTCEEMCFERRRGEKAVLQGVRVLGY